MVDYKEYTQEQIEKAEKILSDRKVIENPLCTFYVTLGQSSNSKNVRFVLYRWLNKVISPYVNPFQFVGILCDDLIEACEKSLVVAGVNPILIDFDVQRLKKEKMKPNFIPFGKYKGKHIEDILETDPQYIYWLSNNYSGNNKGLMYRLDELRQVSREKVIYENRTNSKSNFVGVEGQRINVVGTVQSIYPADFNGFVIKIMDTNGNFLTKTGTLPKNLKKGDVISIEGMVKKHYEKMGIKHTSFGGRCKMTIN